MKTKILSLIDNRINGISDKNLFDALSNSFYIDFLKELRQEIEEMEDMIYTINKECDRNEMPNNPEDLRKFLNDNWEKQYPTIDPIKEIDKMIEELRSIYENQSKGSLYWLAYKSWHDTLQELKSRLYPLTQK